MLDGYLKTFNTISLTHENKVEIRLVIFKPNAIVAWHERIAQLTAIDIKKHLVCMPFTGRLAIGMCFGRTLPLFSYRE
jgi:hypothetical protein